MLFLYFLIFSNVVLFLRLAKAPPTWDSYEDSPGYSRDMDS